MVVNRLRLKGGEVLAALLVAGLALAAAEPAAAAVYGTAVTDEDPGTAGINGTRSVDGGGLSPDPGYWEDASVSWTITESGGTYSYEYTFEEFAGQGGGNPAISHAIFDLSDDALDGSSLSDPDAVTNVMVDGQSPSLEFGDFDQHGPELVGGFKVEGFPEGASTVTFESNRAPVWGNLFLKGGGGTLINRDYEAIATSTDSDGFIARPNGATTMIPLPAAVWPGLAVLGGLMLGRRRRRAG